MFASPSLLTRIAVGKLAALVLTLLGLFAARGIIPDMSWQFQLGFLFWYITIGAVVGMFGVMTYHPMLAMKLPWWFRGPWVGGWLNAILLLFIFDDLAPMMANGFGEDSIWASPWWLVAEGAVLGLLLDWLCTRIGGEGKECVSDRESLPV
ncbi:MAG: hypothetical protein GY952_06140 [Rhodobacteraceae bacterium]|nr:hypothetical protein [Paracoccaceae bacterium]